MDANAVNFDPEAGKDCNCCTYTGNVVFYYDQTVSNALLSNGITSLTFYVDGQIVGSSAASVYWIGAPVCGQNASITATKDLGNVENKTYSYSVRSQANVELWAGVVNFTANTCQPMHLIL